MATTRRPTAALRARGGMPTIGDVIEVPITSLTIPFYVRKKLDQDHVLYLAELMENGVELDPIRVHPNAMGDGYDVNDGRHRMQASQLLDRATIRARIEAPKGSIVEEISDAFKANCGGALPPSREDVEHTTSLLIAQGVKPTEIAKLIPIPASLARKYVNQVYSRQLRARMKQAMESVTDGDLTLAKAAEKFEVDADTLRKAMGGRKKASQLRLAEILSVARRRARSYSQTNAAQVRKLIEAFEEGEVPYKMIDATLKALRASVRHMGVSIDSWEQRAVAARDQQVRLAKVKGE